MDDGNHDGDEAAASRAGSFVVDHRHALHHHRALPHQHQLQQQHQYEQQQHQYQQHHSQQPQPHPHPQHHHYLQHQQHQQFHPTSPDSSDDSPSFPPSPFDSRPSQIPVASYAAANAQAFAANARPDDVALALANPVEPDDFYRSYRGVQSGDAAPVPVKDPMASASAIPTSRQTPSLRSNGNGITPKHPSVTAVGRAGTIRPSLRSVSNPADDRNGGTTRQPGGVVPPSVKDLKKKFDQNSSQSSSTPRKNALRPSRDNSTSGTNGRSQGSGSSTGSATSYATLRSSTATRDTGHEIGKASGARGTQRPKYVAEDQTSANSQSFASRISRPRNPVSPNAQASKSLTHLDPDTPSPELPTSPPLTGRSNGLLFGEILPEDSDSVTVGFGIDGGRPRRTSESSVQLPRPHVRSFSDPDPEMEPSSPTDWYRGAAAAQQGPDQHAPKTATKHSRAHSDVAGSKPPAIRTNQRGQAASKHTNEHSPTSPTSPTSRLPVLIKKMNSSSRHASPGSTRSNSPATLKQASASGRTSRQHGTLAARARTPTNRSSTPTTVAKIPTHGSSSGSTRKAPPSNIATSSNGRLNAYVSVPTPKLSPSLRSSRPRQSVATATTAASRMKAVDRAPSPQRSRQSNSRPISRAADEPTTRRRKISVGPIDFAQRRETIKLAYSKSIRETQASQARQAAADRRKKELEVVARVKVEAEAATIAAAAAASASNTAVPSPVSDSGRPPELAMPKEKRVTVAEPLRIATSLPSIKQPIEIITHLDSPTLGIPGSFPGAGSPRLDDEEIPIPQSAVSTTITEFDPEEQTEPPRPESVQESTAAIDRELEFMIPVQNQIAAEAEPPTQPPLPTPALHRKASYQYPFDEDEIIEDEDDDVSIKIALDPSAQSSAQPTPTRSEFDPEPAIPEPREDEYEPQPYTYSSPNYETTVTILGPETDFTPSYKDQPRETMPVPELLQADDPPVIATPEIVASEVSHSVDFPPEEPRIGLENLDRLEDFYVGSRLHDNIAALRDSTLTSSDVDVSYDPPPSSAEYQRTPDTSHSLAVPALLAPANRLSQNSAWTDFSFGSDDRDAGAASSVTRSQELEFREGRPTSKLTPSGNINARGSSLEDLNQSPEYSPLDKPSASPHMLAELPRDKHRLPDLDTGDGFAILYLPQPRRIPVLPDHEPPPPPGNAYQIIDPVLGASTRPNSYLHNEEDEGPEVPQAKPTREPSKRKPVEVSESPTATKSGFKDKAQPAVETPSPLGEEQKRLRQRQLVIRELVDTEDLFVRDMSVVEEIYKGTAEACPKLDSKTIKLVFRNTDEIIAFHTSFLAQLKESVSSVYTPKGRRSPVHAPESMKDSDSATLFSTHSRDASIKPELDNERDRQTSLGPVFSRNIEQLKAVHEVYLRSSDLSSKRLLQIQEDEGVIVWLSECNEVAKELTSAWNLDSLLIKPMQRITKYPDIITHLLKFTPADHPDRESLIAAKATVMTAIEEINKTKKNFELVGQIVGSRKRKESDVRAGIARAFGKRVDKLQVANNRTADDDEFSKLHERFADDYLRLQVVLRDVEYYTRNVATYVHEFLQYLSSMELVMRLQPSREYAHIESKWVQFNVSMRDIEKIALEKHLSDVRKHVIEPFEQVIRCYGNPSLALKKRAKRRLDYDKYVQLKANGKKVDKQLNELVEQYEALNDTLKKELPQLSGLTAKIGNICLGKFVSIQASWYLIWKEKVKGPLQDVVHVPELSEIVNTFQHEFQLQEERAGTIGILNPTHKVRTSQSTTDDTSSILSRTRSRPNDLVPPRGRGLSVNSDNNVPSLPTPDFAKRNSGQFSLSPTTTLPSPANYYRDYYSGINGHSHKMSNSPITPEASSSSRTMGFGRPGTGRSFESSSITRQSSESAAHAVSQNWRDSNSTYNSNYPGPETRRLSGLFHSALPLPDGPDESQRSSRASSRERAANNGYKVLWLAASLFEFNIETTKHEAGYPYLTYQAGEIFDVIAEKGELWLAKNQDDPRDVVGWIWSKHFAKLADS
ncbi:hypothetical protein B0H67DRAFT_84793 [Lasiosphaeris hirsuta]|uniref:DH domain-containing protein n=1 Tax=Lasiosphaeris hirsuta TaxID=260670 RepID=A0AA40E836_9PEZI|nr:hypothetical protein B0H67DRAFT_84793 [Lasiosphaeris hirsuta]